MQLLASPSYNVSAKLRQQPAASGRLAVPFLPSRRPATPVVLAQVTRKQAEAQRDQREDVPPSAHPPQASSVSREAPVVPDQPSPSQASGLLSSVGKSLACLAVAAVLCLGNAGTAFARSGGYAGGSSFQAGPSRSFSSGPRSSYSSPRSSYGPQYRAPPTRGGMPRRGGPTIITVPGMGPSFSPYASPFSPFSPYGPGPMIMGPRVAIAPPVVVPFNSLAAQLVMAVGVTLWLTSASRAVAQRTAQREGTINTDTQIGPYTVARVQVGALAVAHQLKAELNEIASKADTSTPKGLHSLLQEVVKALQRHPEYIVLADTKTRKVGSQDAAERVYNQLAAEARGTFDEETLVNYGGKPVRSKGLSAESNSIDELMVISLVVAGQGTVSLPAVKTVNELEAVLKRLAALNPNDLKAVQLTWTPQAKGDALSQEEVLEHFPQLQPVL